MQIQNILYVYKNAIQNLILLEEDAGKFALMICSQIKKLKHVLLQTHAHLGSLVIRQKASV